MQQTADVEKLLEMKLLAFIRDVDNLVRMIVFLACRDRRQIRCRVIEAAVPLADNCNIEPGFLQIDNHGAFAFVRKTGLLQRFNHRPELFLVVTLATGRVESNA